MGTDPVYERMYVCMTMKNSELSPSRANDVPDAVDGGRGNTDGQRRPFNTGSVGGIRHREDGIGALIAARMAGPQTSCDSHH
ncbi:hypothetical protein RB195_001188 [Necator americanus]